MTDDTINAAILQLQSQLSATMGQMKDMARRRTEPEDPSVLAQHAVRAATLQSGIQALSQLKPDILESGKEALRLAEDEPTPAMVEEEAEEEAEDADAEEDPDVLTYSDIEARRLRPSYSEED